MLRNAVLLYLIDYFARRRALRCAMFIIHVPNSLCEADKCDALKHTLKLAVKRKQFVAAGLTPVRQ